LFNNKQVNSQSKETMPTSKSKRKPTTKAKVMSPKPVHREPLVVETATPEQREKARQAQHAISCLVKLGAREADMKDWMFVHYRIIMGLYIAQHYYEYNPELEEVFSAGLDRLGAMMVRVHLTGEFILRMMELDDVTEALNVTSLLTDKLNLLELKHVNFEVKNYYERVIEKNMQSYPFETLERIKMMQTLAQEKQEAKAIPEQLEAA